MVMQSAATALAWKRKQRAPEKMGRASLRSYDLDELPHQGGLEGIAAHRVASARSLLSVIRGGGGGGTGKTPTADKVL